VVVAEAAAVDAKAADLHGIQGLPTTTTPARPRLTTIFRSSRRLGPFRG